MDIKTMSMTILAIVVAGVVLGASLPLVASIGTEPVSVENENAQWIRMAYITNNSNYSFNVDIDGDVKITNGASIQTGEYEDMIIYADSYNSIFISDDDVILTGSDLHDGTNWWFLGDNFTVSRTSGVVTVTEGGDTITLGQPSWAYVPIGNGGYSSFAQGGINRDSSPLVAVGSYAGVYCYNNYVSPDVGLVMDADVTSTFINSVRWALESDLSDELIDFDPGLIDFDPGLIQPIDIDPIGPGDQIMTVPTPTYTDGDWGYNLNYGGYAVIVSYSGAGGGPITIPSTVGGIDVKEVGKGGTNETVFDTSLSVTGLTISEGIETINNHAFNICANLTGTLTLPDSLKKIGQNAFNGCSFTGTLVIPDGVTSMGPNAFKDCDFTGPLVIPDGLTNLDTSAFRGVNFTGPLVIPDGITSIGASTFRDCNGFTGTLVISSNITSIGSYAFSVCSGLTGLVVLSDATPGANAFSNTASLKEILNLGSATYTTTSYGLNAEEVRTDIEASNYIGPNSHYEPETNTSPTIIMLDMLPLIMALGLVIACGVMISRRW